MDILKSQSRYMALIGVIALVLGLVVIHVQKTPSTDEVSANKQDYDLSRCDSFKVEEDKLSCQRRLVFEFIFESGDIGHCEKLPEDHQSTCRLKGVIYSVKKGASVDLCDQLEENVVEDCKYNVVMQLVNHGGDQSLCDELTKTTNKKLCQEKHAEIKNQLVKYNSLSLQMQDFLAAGIASDTGGILASEVETEGFDQSLIYEQADVKILAVEHLSRNTDSSTPFTQVEAVQLGIDVNTHTSLDFDVPFDQGKGISSGDFDNDGWVDLLFATKSGVRLYKNNSHGGFERVTFTHPELDNLDVFIASFVDLNNDGWLDIFLTSYGAGEFIVFNDQEGFLTLDVRKIAVEGKIVAHSAAFADIDQDADLDFYMGYLSNGRDSMRHWKNALNILAVNDRGRFAYRELDQEPGESLTTLFADINLDGFVDLLVGNDFNGSDSIFLGDGSLEFTPILPENNVIPVTPFFNMSYDSGDVNNDLLVDIFSVDLGDLTSYTQHQVNTDYCIAIQNQVDRKKCEDVLSVYDIIDNNRTEDCLKVEDTLTRDHCMLAILTNFADQGRNLELCERIPDSYASLKTYCRSMAGRNTDEYLEPLPGSLDQQTQNVLLIGKEDGTFELRTEEYGVADSHWSWNARLADLDNDTWQDIYVGNGYDFDNHFYTSNIFFHNQEGMGFLKKQEEFGLTNYLHTPSYTLFDIDNDGDLDIASHSVNAPAVIYTNNESQNQTVTFELRDRKGNFFGIGTKIFITYKGGQQMRELKSGGGFLSFDAPMIHFGLGDADKIDQTIIHWSTGEKTVIEEDLSTGRKYILVRE